MESGFQLLNISAICEETKTTEKAVKEFLAENKYKIASAAGATIVGVAAAPVALGAVGLGAAGAAIGSIASATQAALTVGGAGTGAFSAIAGAGFLGGMAFMSENGHAKSDFCNLDHPSEPQESTALTSNTNETGRPSQSGPHFICDSEGRCCLNRNS